MRRLLLIAILAVSLVAASASHAGEAPAEVQPAAVAQLTLAVSGTYVPVAGAFDCDAGSPGPGAPSEEPGILWYAPGPAPDYLWTDLAASGGAVARTQQQLSISGTYEPIVGDFDGDRCSDILWYGPGTVADFLWWGGPAGFRQGAPIAVRGTYRPAAGNLDSRVGSEILWYDPDGRESIWRATGDRSAPFVNGTFPQVAGSGYRPVIYYSPWSGAPQLFWYAPGPGADSVWSMTAGPTGPTLATSRPITLNASYRTASCGLYVVLHGPGSVPDWTLTQGSTLEPKLTPLSIAGSYRVAGSRETQFCTTVWHGPGSAPDQVWLQVP
jgi:hypothetical protein